MFASCWRSLNISSFLKSSFLLFSLYAFHYPVFQIANTFFFFFGLGDFYSTFKQIHSSNVFLILSNVFHFLTVVLLNYFSLLWVSLSSSILFPAHEFLYDQYFKFFIRHIAYLLHSALYLGGGERECTRDACFWRTFLHLPILLDCVSMD